MSAKGDGRYVISNGKDQALRLWDLRKMRTNEEPTLHMASVITTTGMSALACLYAFFASYLDATTIVLQLWAISETKPPSASIGL